MNDLVNALQTLTLVAVLVLVLSALCWSVYTFSKFAKAFNKIIEALEKSTEKPSAIVPVPEPQTVQEDEPEPVEIKRYGCHRCHARLPEEPVRGIVKDEVSLLVFKCRRCGKETEVDPATTPPVTENK